MTTEGTFIVTETDGSGRTTTGPTHPYNATLEEIRSRERHEQEDTMTTVGTSTRKVVTVPRGPHAVTEAIEKSGLVNIESTGITAVTSLTYTYAIIGDEPSTDTIRLTIELAADDLNSIQAALGRAAHDQPNPDFARLELLHLRTLLAEAAAPDRKDTT